MAIEVKPKPGEAGNSLLYSFTRRIKRSGVLKEMRARRFSTRAVSKIKRKQSAIHREQKRVNVERQRKLGLL